MLYKTILSSLTISGFQGSKFDILWDELDGYFNKHNNTVVNELRTDATLSISIRRIFKQLIKALSKHCSKIMNNSLQIAEYYEDEQFKSCVQNI
ncbi:unnamed protein product [Rhizophagus irregularis]|nr:unnamed protein product [Rhizophagus irregularis]